MKGSIQRFPSALLPLLSIKSSETPIQLSEDVGASLEMLPFYVADRLETVSNVVAGVTTAFAQSRIQVPANEYWYLYTVQATATVITVGSNVQMTCGVQTPDGVAVSLGTMLQPVVSIAGQGIDLVGPAPSTLLLKPGSFLFAATQVAPTSLSLTVRGLIARLSSNS